jgi:glycosyltransferase involved in cell wall biosynthesis/2-polyprenyl-3-methyl-5-hydroxy-6-metoxy-1,4-benzoquinol methylase
MSKNKYEFTLNTAEMNDSHMGLASRIKPKQKVLELGCSSGYLSKFLKEELACHVVAVDIDKHATEQAKEFCEKVIVADLDNQTWLKDIEDETFDVILCADVLEHLKNPVQLLSSLKPFLHAESRLLASVPNVAHVSIRLELLLGHFDYESLGLLDDTHLHFYTRDGLILMLMQAGYVCSDISYSIQDLADEAVDYYLEKMGLEASEETRKLLRAPDAVAYQFIIEALPAKAELVQHKPLPLTPKPLVKSGTFFGEKQEKIEILEQQVKALSPLELQLKNEQEHNKNHLKAIEDWRHTTSVVDNALFDLSDKLKLEQEKNGELLAQTIDLQKQVSLLHTDNQHLEEVLKRVHNKVSYRAVRGLKNTFSKKEQQVEQLSKEDTKTKAHDYDAWLAEYGEVTEKQLENYKSEIASWDNSPKIAILMPVYNPDKACLVNAIESVINQVYSNFELCIADDASTESYVQEVLREYSEKDSRIKVSFRDNNGHISAASNSALALVDAEYVALMDHDDLLTADALFWVAKTIDQNPEVQLIYSDEDKMDLQGKRFAPYFKPDWNPELFLSHNFICHLGVYKTEKVRVLGGFDSALDGAQDYDLALRFVDQLNANQIVHIPRILYHWRAVEGSTANGVHEKPYAESAIAKAVKNDLQRRGRSAEVLAHSTLHGALRVRYQLPDTIPLVSIVIPTRNGFNLLRRCVDSIIRKTKYSNYEIIIIDNGSDDFVAVRYLQRLQEENQVKIIRDDSHFNYAALNNKAVTQAKGEVIALLNNDLEVINDDWLDEMVSHVVHSEVGAVGAKLYYPDDTIQHAGVIVGLGGVAGHSHKHFPRNNAGHCGRLLLVQNLTAVTAACLLVRKEVFDSVGGFDEKNLSVAFNDVDLCLRIQEKGFNNVWTPYAELYHYESATRGYEDTPEKQARFNKEVSYMKQRWGNALLVDPAYNPNLTLDREDFSFAWPPRS